MVREGRSSSASASWRSPRRRLRTLAQPADELRERPKPSRLDVLAQRQPPGPPRPHHAVGVGVAAPRGVALGDHEHVRAQRGETPAAQRAAVGAWPAVRCRAHGVPTSIAERVGHVARLAACGQRAGACSQHELALHALSARRLPNSASSALRASRACRAASKRWA
jgi:hypothetical protein